MMTDPAVASGPTVTLGRTGLQVSPVGLGCSRLGSTMGVAHKGALDLVRHALDRGVTLFDTADIYGQGDSERLLGTALGHRRSDVVLVSKAGQRFTSAQRAMAVFKKPIRAASQRLPMLRNAVASRRAGKLPRDFRPQYVERALMGSLKRLGTDWLDIFLLHSPDAAELRDCPCIGLLDQLRDRGVVRHWGISCDDRATAEIALSLPGASVLQIPLADMQPDLVAKAAASGTALLVREIYANPPDPLISSTVTPGWRGHRIAAALALPNAVALVGTTRPAHLDQALDMLICPVQAA